MIEHVIQQDRRWMEASDVKPMFPSLVWKIQLESGLRDSLNASITAALAELRREGAPLPVGQGWQSRHTLHRRVELRELVTCVERGVTSVLRFLRIGQDVFEITGCWATVLAQGAAHRRITVSFNVMLSSFADQLSQPLWSGEGSS